VEHYAKARQKRHPAMFYQQDASDYLLHINLLPWRVRNLDAPLARYLKALPLL
jgi:hypothetical protein